MKFRRFLLAIAISFLVSSNGWGEANLSFGVKNPTIQSLYLEGVQSSQTRSGIKAAQNSLTYNNEGITPAEGLNYYLSVDLSGKVAPLELFLEPLVSVNQDAHGTIHKGYIRLATSGFNFDVGKESLWWGQGVHGGLFLTNNAEPLPMLRLFNPSPTLLPSILRYLGPFQFDIFFSQLEEDRVVPKPYFQGTRFVFTPHPILDVGLTRTIIMGGEGRRGITLPRFYTIWFGENRVGDAEQSNSIAGIDFRLTFPEGVTTPAAQIYGEAGGEDEAGGYPSEDSFLFGIYLPENQLRIEYADLSNPSWYIHSVYQSGYTYKGRILGHHVGGGGRDLFIEKGLMKTNSVTSKINFDYEERGIATEPVRERHYQAGTDWRLNAGKMMIPWTGQAGFAYDWIRNAGYIAHFNQENFLLTLSLIGQM